MAREYDNIIVMGKSGAGKQPRIEVLTETFGLKQLSTGDIFRTYLGKFNALHYHEPLDRFFDARTDTFIDDGSIKEALDISSRDDVNDLVLGLKAKYFVDQGRFVPDEITNALLDAAFGAMGYCGAVLDGYPRTLAQARYLLDLAEREKATLDAILLVENDDESIIQRTTGRRICTSCGAVFHVEYKPPPADGHCAKQTDACEIVQRSDDTVESLKTRLQEFRTKAQPAIDYMVAQGIPLYRVPGNLPEFSPEAVQASVMQAMKIS